MIKLLKNAVSNAVAATIVTIGLSLAILSDFLNGKN